MGRAISLELCRSGMQIFVADLNLTAAEKTVLAAQGLPGQADACGVDISQSTSVASLFSDLRQRAERLDLLVHTAAILGQTVSIEDLDDDQWRRMISVNLDGAFY